MVPNNPLMAYEYGLGRAGVLLLKDAGPVYAGAKGKTDALSCVCANPSMLPMVVHLKKAKPGEGSFKNTDSFSPWRWLESIESCPSAPDFYNHSSQNLEGSFPLPITYQTWSP